MSTLFEKIYEDIERGILDSSYAKSYRIRKWILIDCLYIYLAKTNSFSIKNIEIPFIDIQFPQKETTVGWALILLAYLLVIYSMNLFSVVTSDYLFLIEKKRTELIAIYVKQKIEQQAIVEQRFKQALQRYEVLAERKASESVKPSDQETIFRNAYQFESDKLNQALHNSEHFINTHIRRVLIPDILIDVIRYSLVYVASYYVTVLL